MDLKDHGNELFKAGKLQDACTVYTDALRKLEGDEEHKALTATLRSNRAACWLKLGKPELCVEDCSKALEQDPANVKILYRRAQAEVELKHVEPAYRDLRLLLEIDKDNKAAVALMKKVRAVAQDLNSTTTQAMDVLDVALGAASAAERTSKLRQVLGSILEDEHLAKAIASKGACEKLWTMRESDAMALKVLSKMAEYDGCFRAVLECLSGDELAKIVCQDSEESLDAPAAALNIMWRLVLHEDDVANAVAKAESAAAEPVERKLDVIAVIGVLVEALRSENDSLRRIAVEGSVRLCTNDKDRARAFVEAEGLAALMTMISRDFRRDEPMQQVSVVLGQVLPSLKDDDLIKAQAVAFCKPYLTSDDVHDQIKGAAGLDAIFFANKELGLALVKEEALLDVLMRIARFGSERAQALTAEIFSHLANTEDGRNMLAGPPTDMLKLLAASDGGPVRSAAAVALAKLNAIDFNAESENGMLVLSSVVSLLDVKASKEEHAKGVEAVSFVINDSQVKMMFIKGEGLKVLRELVKLGTENAKEAYGYGIAFVLENLTTSLDDKRREKLREMEVSEEQWEQFEKLTKSQTRKPGQEDPRENVAMRIKVLVEVGGVGALRALALGSTSDRVWEACARTLCNVATVQDVRRQIIAQGGLRALFKLASVDGNKTKQFAAHALAKIFVTTDPHVLKDEQLMDTIGPLVRQVRHCDEDLVIFECCMALTNIATVSFEAKQKMVNAKAIPAFEYAQYSDNLMVRRAATEAINNLIPTEEVIEWICMPEKLKLWLLFAQAWDEDAPTACAAAGALANLAGDERVAKALADQEEDALAKLVELATCSNLDIVHRVVVCLLCLVESWPEGKGKEAMLKAGVDKAMAQVLATFPESSAAPVAKECLEALS